MEKAFYTSLRGIVSSYQHGTSLICFSVMAFLSETGKGIQIEYPTITLHAIARGEAGPTIYCQLDEASQGQGNDGGNETDEAQDMRELKLIPADPASRGSFRLL